jgi:tetratricopeptide (TPR) repeat protein
MKYNLVFILAVIISFTSCDSKENIDSALPVDTVAVIEIDSLEYLTNNIKSNSNNPKNWADRSYFFLSQGSVKDALIDMSTAVELDSNNIQYRTDYANLLVATLDLENAMQNYEFVLSVDSSNANAYVGIGRIYALIENPGMATGYLNKAYEIDPHLSEAYFLEGLIYRSDYYATGREDSWNRALTSFQTAVEQNPKYYAAYIEMGVMNDERQNDIALDYYNSALAIAPNSTEAWYNKAMFFQMREKLEEAKICYRTIIDLDSNYTQAYYNQGYIKLVFEKDYDSSIIFFERSLEVDSLYYFAYNNIGLSYEKLGDNEKAKLNYRKAIEINPDFKLAKDNLHSLK